jgi:hypothetical protein
LYWSCAFLPKCSKHCQGTRAGITAGSAGWFVSLQILITPSFDSGFQLAFLSPARGIKASSLSLLAWVAGGVIRGRSSHGSPPQVLLLLGPDPQALSGCCVLAPPETFLPRACPLSSPSLPDSQVPESEHCFLPLLPKEGPVTAGALSWSLPSVDSPLPSVSQLQGRDRLRLVRSHKKLGVAFRIPLNVH